MKFLSILAMLMFTVPVNAGNRHCRQNICAPAFQYQQPQYVQQPQQVINISNVYPQGQSVYGVSAASQLYGANPNLAITLASTSLNNASGVMSQALKLGQINTEKLGELAKLQAATEHLRLAMGSSSQSSSLQLQINQGGSSTTESSGTYGEPRRASIQGSMLQQKCASCHGSTLTEPKGGRIFDSSTALSAANGMRALDLLRGNQVPSGMQKVIQSLSAEDKGQLMSEILNKWSK